MLRRTRALVGLLAVVIAALWSVGAAAEKIAVDYLLENGLVFDGTGAEGRVLYVGIRGERIVFVGADASNIDAVQRLDASGLVVSPGFIDMHTHAYNERPEAGPYYLSSYVTQGVTTVVSGNDGQGPVGIGELRHELTGRGLNANMALYIGHGAIRRAVLGMEDRAPTSAELEAMKVHVAKAMKDGALGLSSGLFYAPGSYAHTDEIIDLAKVAAKLGGFYDSHIRDESNYSIGLLAAVDEVIEIARKADIPAHIAHIKALGVDVWGYSDGVIKRVEEARASGLKVTADQYPWLASSTSLRAVLIPRWAMAGGRDKMKERLQDSALLPKIKKEMAENMRRRGGPGSLLLTRGRSDWLGLTLDEYAAKKNMQVLDAAIDIEMQGGASVASFNMLSDDVENFMQQPWVMGSSDGGSGHPRKFASFPKKYHDYVKQKKLLTLAEFIRRSTSAPAETLGLRDRGVIEVGAYADIVVFDPDSFAPRATYDEPTLTSEGVVHLFVNGGHVISEKIEQKILPGKMIAPDR